MESDQTLKEKNKKLTIENSKLRQQVQSQKYEIRQLKKDLYVKEVLLKTKDDLKSSAIDVLEEVKAELELTRKKITKKIVKLEEPPIKEVNFPLSKRAESYDSVLPPSTSEDSEDYDSNASNHGSSIRSDETVIKTPVDRLQKKEVERSLRNLQLTSDEQSDEPSELTTQSDTNSSALFARPVQVKSPSGSELSDAVSTDAKVLTSRHTKELALPTQLMQRSAELGVLKEQASISAGCKTKDRKPTATQPNETCEYMLKFKKITQKYRPP